MMPLTVVLLMLNTSETKFLVYDEMAIVTVRLKRTRVVAGATANDDWRFTKHSSR